MEAGGASDIPGTPDLTVQSAVRVAERPIAPGKVLCPKPPWDTAFPGAFFHRVPLGPPEEERTLIATDRRCLRLALLVPSSGTRSVSFPQGEKRESGLLLPLRRGSGIGGGGSLGGATVPQTGIASFPLGGGFG